MSRALLRASAVLAAALLALALTACEDDLPASVDPAQVDAVEAPELGACRDLTTDDIAQPSNATRVVDCNDDHTAMTYAVGSLPEELHDADYDADELGAFAFAECSKRFVKLLGADESLAMRTVLTWAWFRPSEEAWDQGARWYRCDVVGGGGQTKELLDLPADVKGLMQRPRGRVAGLRGRAYRGRFGEGAVLGGARLAGRVDDQAGRARRPLPGRPRLARSRRATTAPSRWARGWATRSTTTTATPGSTRPSGTPATAGRSAGRRRASERTPYDARAPPASPVALVLGACSGSDSGSEPSGSNRPRPPSPAPPNPPPRRRLPRPRRCRRNRACYDYGYAAAVAPVARGESVPCDRDHTAITFSVGELDTVVDGHLVSVDSDRVQAQVAGACPQAFEEFVGGTVEARRLSMLRPVWFTPTLRQSDAGANWYRCDAVAIAADETLAPLVGRLQGVLARPLAAERYAMCGTAEPGTAGFRRVICSADHAWRALSTVDIAGRAYPGVEQVRGAGQQTCQDVASAAGGRPAQLPLGLRVADRAAVAVRPALRDLLGTRVARWSRRLRCNRHEAPQRARLSLTGFRRARRDLVPRSRGLLNLAEPTPRARPSLAAVRLRTRACAAAWGRAASPWRS